MRDNIINLVDRIIEGKKSGIDMRELEEEVDRLVYGLYELSEEEIKIIEGKDWFVGYSFGNKENIYSFLISLIVKPVYFEIRLISAPSFFIDFAMV